VIDAPRDGRDRCLAVRADVGQVKQWRSTRGGRFGAIQKYEMLLAFADAPALDRSGQTYENARLVLRLRNAILHYRPEDVGRGRGTPAREALRGTFDDNPVMAGSHGKPWWPDDAVGHGAAMWAHRSRGRSRITCPTCWTSIRTTGGLSGADGSATRRASDTGILDG